MDNNRKYVVIQPASQSASQQVTEQSAIDSVDLQTCSIRQNVNGGHCAASTTHSLNDRDFESNEMKPKVK